jgi:hypothetical protein
MSKESSGFVVRLRALLDTDWAGVVGDRFRKTLGSISDWTTRKHLTPSEVLDEGVTLGRRKLEGAASVQYATATKNFADVENIRIDIAFRSQTLESRIQQERAQAVRATAEANVAKINEFNARLDLFTRLKDLGVVVRVDDNGEWLFARAAESYDWKSLESALIQSSEIGGSVLPPPPTTKQEGGSA